MPIKTNIKFGLAALVMGLFVFTSCSKDELEAPKQSNQATSTSVVGDDFIEKGAATDDTNGCPIGNHNITGINDGFSGDPHYIDPIGDSDDSGLRGGKGGKKSKPKVIVPIN